MRYCWHSKVLFEVCYIFVLGCFTFRWGACCWGAWVIYVLCFCFVLCIGYCVRVLFWFVCWRVCISLYVCWGEGLSIELGVVRH